MPPKCDLRLRDEHFESVVNDSTARDKAVVSGNLRREGNPQQKEYKEKGVIDSGCSRYMTGNKCYLTDFEAYDGGFVSFGDGKGRISGKGIENHLDSKVKVIRTLIEAARTMLVDSKFPTTFWEEAINTACYVLNRALMTKPHSKTPYVLIRGRPPLIDFKKPFGCLVTILNTRDNLGKFEGKANEGYFVGPDWLFDINSLTISMNYVPVVARNQTNGIAGFKENLVAGSKDSTVDAGKKAPEVDESKASDNGRKNDQVSRSEVESLPQQARPSASTNAFKEHSFERFSPFKNAFSLPHVSIVTLIDDTGIFGNGYDDEVLEEEVDMNNVDSSYTIPEATNFLKDHPKEQTLVDFPKDKWAIGTKWVYKNKNDEIGIVIKNKARLDALGHTQEEGIDYDEVFAPVARIEAIRLFLAYASFQYFFSLPNGYQKCLSIWKNRRGGVRLKKTLFIKRHKDDILLVQVYFDDIIFGSTKKELSTEFEKLMHDKFQMSSMGELSFFLGLQVKQKSDGIFISQDKYMAKVLKKFDFVKVKIASTPMESNKPLIKDEEAKVVDVHFYRSMIGSLMYLTSSRPDIKFVVCACASLDRKSTTGGCQFLGKRLILWQCKKQTIVANSTTEVEYVATANCCGLVLWIQNKMLDYGFNLMNTKIYIDNESTTCIVKNPVFHSKTKHIEIRHHFIKDSYEKKLIQVIKIHTDKNVADLLIKAFNVSRFQFLNASIGLLNL
nr:retrotransposon protein, putative, Ty1-copia subclass [Tanacetum cinerariifolium]